MAENARRVRPADWPMGLSVHIALTVSPTGIDVGLSVAGLEPDDDAQALALDALVEHVGVQMRAPAGAAAAALAAALGQPVDPDTVPLERS